METNQQSRTRLLVRLSQVSPTESDRVGAKAANQAALLRAGFPVPDGVVITTDAYATFVEENANGPAGTLESVDSAPVPDAVRTALDQAIATLGNESVAVRSSAVAEDLPSASFAGQYETVLNVRGAREVERAVKRCWASASGAHVAAYRSSRGMPSTSMAVLIQRMIDAEAAGVAFSANPVTGARGEVVINAVRGLGDKLVSGQVSPDEWVVRGPDACCQASLEGAIDARQAQAIAEMARRVEAHFGRPQDIEWAITDGQLYLLQARPITSLLEATIEPVPIEFEVPPGFWQHDPSHNPRPGYPVDVLLLPLIRPTSQRWAREFGYLFDGLEYREMGLWVYQRMVPLGGREGPSLPTWLMRLLVRTVPTLRRRVRQASDAVRSDKAGRFVQRWYEEWQPELSGTVSRYLAVDLGALSDRDLDRQIESTYGLVEQGIEIHMLLSGAVASILYELVRTCEELLGWDLARTMDLVSGTSFKSTEPARRLHQLAEMADSRPPVRRLLEEPGERVVTRMASVDGEFARAFDAYLHKYGCRVLRYSIGEPTLAEMPALFVNMIRGQIERGYHPEQDEAATESKRASAAREARTMLAGRPKEQKRFERALERAERAYPVREDNEFFTISAPWALLRYAVLEVGRRLANRGVIAQPDDVIFLQLKEARSALFEGGNRRSLIEERKGQRAWAELNPGPPSYGEPPPPPSLDFLPADARLPMEAMIWSMESIMAMGANGQRAQAAGSTLRGFAASAGSYTGPVRVIMDETQFDKLRPGDVLVCPITSPVWSVLFPTIGALVTDTGGLLSHPAIIAREYRVPAVVATSKATELLRDGQMVTVDGTTGVVEVVP